MSAARIAIAGLLVGALGLGLEARANAAKTAHPVVFAHGMGGFDNILGFDYWGNDYGTTMSTKNPPPEPLPFPSSLCHRCAAPPRYVQTKTSTFIMCPLLPQKYPPQPVLSCALFRPADPKKGG